LVDRGLEKEMKDGISDKGPSPFNDMPAIKIGLEGVYKILNRLQIHKATGPDKISCRILKEMAAEVAPILPALLLSPFLNIGTTLAVFQSVGSMPWLIEAWKKR
jgi:hypothetical protein